MTTTHYDINYGNFQTSLYEEIRRDAYGEDIGQYSWLTAGEQDKLAGVRAMPHAVGSCGS
jgi:hypothetical protein